MPGSKERIEMQILRLWGTFQELKISARRISTITGRYWEENYISPITKKPLSPASIKKDCLVISAFLSYAVSEGMLNMNMLIYSGKISRSPQTTQRGKAKVFYHGRAGPFYRCLQRPCRCCAPSTPNRGKMEKRIPSKPLHPDNPR